MITTAELVELADEFLKVQWDEVSLGGTVDALLACIDAYDAIGIFTAEKLELWRRRVQTCPGHNGSQAWCVYCGDIPCSHEAGCGHEIEGANDDV